jgi:transcription elongation factor Elf1
MKTKNKNETFTCACCDSRNVTKGVFVKFDDSNDYKCKICMHCSKFFSIYKKLTIKSMHDIFAQCDCFIEVINNAIKENNNENKRGKAKPKTVRIRQNKTEKVSKKRKTDN